MKPTIEIGRLCEGSYLAWYRSICFILSCTRICLVEVIVLYVLDVQITADLIAQSVIV
jgi:hypothetical protein